MSTDAPQVSTAPDPIAMMPAASVKYIDIPKDISQDPPLFQLLTETIKSAPAALAVVATNVANGAMSMVNNVMDYASSAASAMNPNHLLPGKGTEIEGPDVPAKSKELSRDIGIESLGQLTAPSTPSVDIQQGQSLVR